MTVRRPFLVRLEVSGIDNVKLSITPGTNPVVRCPKIWCWSSCTPSASSVIVMRGHRRSGRKGQRGERENAFFVFPSRSKPTDLRTALSNLNDEKTRARERESDIRREEKRVSERRFTSSRENKNAFRVPSLVGIRLWSVSRLRRLITIGEWSTELCLSCVRDITADARRNGSRWNHEKYSR